MEQLDEHVSELRQRAVRIAVFYGVVAVALFAVSRQLLAFFQQDIAIQLHALAIYEVIYMQLLIAFLGAAVISLPVFYIEALGFMKPGLTRDEYRVLKHYLPVSVLLFFGGAVFAYRFVAKPSVQFFARATQAADVTQVWGLQNTVGFMLKLSAFVGLAFQLPVVAYALGKAGLLTQQTMRTYRVYCYVAALVLAAVATPPDLFTQMLITAPVIALYEFSIRLVPDRSDG